jgi:hypothetical protein
VTPIQIAFQMKNGISFEYFVEKYGAEYALDQLLQVHGTKEAIIQFASYAPLNKILSSRLGLN